MMEQRALYRSSLRRIPPLAAFCGHRGRKSLSVCLILVLLEILLAQCTYESSVKQTTWHLVVPDDYQGFLVIMYNCPEGEPLKFQGDRVEIVFSDEGVYCTSNEPFGWEGQVFASTRSGQLLQGPALWNKKGYGFYGDGLITVHGPPVYRFDVYWAGDLEYLASIRNNPDYKFQLNEFLLNNFGIQIS